jgi:hypothetical protein
MNDIFDEFAKLAGRLMAWHWLRTCRNEDAEAASAEVANQVTRKTEIQDNGRHNQGEISKAVQHLAKS